jgi:hypothetical protein
MARPSAAAARPRATIGGLSKAIKAGYRPPNDPALLAAKLRPRRRNPCRARRTRRPRPWTADRRAVSAHRRIAAGGRCRVNQRKRPVPTDRPSSKSTAADAPDSSVQAAWQRRHEAASRLVPLHCGCADPWIHRCTSPALSAAALDGWLDAAQHVLANGWIPLLPLEIRRALWRRQGADRLLAERVHRACGEVVA